MLSAAASSWHSVSFCLLAIVPSRPEAFFRLQVYDKFIILLLQYTHSKYSNDYIIVNILYYNQSGEVTGSMCG